MNRRTDDPAGAPTLTVARGAPTPDELAALCAVLLTRVRRAADPGPAASPRRSRRGWSSRPWTAPCAWSPTQQAWRA